MTDIALRILLQAQNQMSGVIKSVVSDLAGMNPVLGGIATAGLAVVAGTVAIGTVATKMAGDFEQAMLSNVAHAGLAKDQIDAVSQSVLRMAPIVGRAPTQLAEALYPILSAFSGIQNQSAKSAIALDTLKMSFQTVAGTAVDGTAVANAAVGTFNALGLATSNAGENTKRMTGLFDIMDKTVQLGNMQWDAYKNVVSKLAVAVQGTGISFNESQAALATMTNEGFSAQRASTYLSNTFTTLAIKTNALSAHAKKLGIEFDASKYGPMSLADKIQYLNEITDGNKQKLLALMGNNSTALKTFNALSVGLGSYRSNLEALNHSQGALASSFGVASQGFNFHMQQMKAAFDVLLVTIGQQLLPIFTRVAAAITPLIAHFAAWLVSSGALKTAAAALSAGIQGFFNVMQALLSIGGAVTGFFQKNQWAVDLLVAVLATIAIQILSVVVPAFIAWAIAAVSAGAATLAAMWPGLLLLAAIAAAIFVVILIIQHWGQIVAWLKGVWSAIASFFVGLWNGIVGVFRRVIAEIVAIFTPIVNVFNAIFHVILFIVEVAIGIVILYIELWVKIIVTVFTPIIHFFQMIWGGIVRIFSPVVAFYGTLFRAAWAAIVAAWSATVSFFTGVWHGITAIWGVVSSWFGQQFALAGAAIKVVFSPILSWFGAVFSALVTAITGALKKIGDGFSGLGTFVHGVWDGIVNAIKGAINFIVDLINKVIGAVDGIHINTPFGSIGFNIPKLPHLATGGTTTSSGLFTVGEEGSENVWLPGGATVFPHNAFSGGGAGGGTVINVAVYAGLMTDRRQADQLATIIANRLATKWRSQANIEQATSGSVRS